MITRISDHTDDLDRNIGMARLWAGVHWRSDHVTGQRLGRDVAGLMIEQLRSGGIPFLPKIAKCDEKPPTIKQLQSDEQAFIDGCDNKTDNRSPGPRCD